MAKRVIKPQKPTKQVEELVQQIAERIRELGKVKKEELVRMLAEDYFQGNLIQSRRESIIAHIIKYEFLIQPQQKAM